MWQIDVVKSTIVNKNKREKKDNKSKNRNSMRGLALFLPCLLTFISLEEATEQVKRFRRRNMISLFSSSTHFIVKLNETKQTKNKNAKYAMCVFGAQSLSCVGHCVCVCVFVVFVHISETLSIPMLRMRLKLL